MKMEGLTTGSLAGATSWCADTGQLYGHRQTCASEGGLSRKFPCQLGAACAVACVRCP